MSELSAPFVEVVEDTPVPTLRVGGEMDVTVAGVLRDHLGRAVTAASGDVVIDMSAVTFLDSRILSELVRAHLALGDVGHGLVVADAAPVVTRLLELTGLTESFRTSTDQHEAPIAATGAARSTPT